MEESATIPSAHDRKAVPSQRLVCPSIIGKAWSNLRRPVGSGRGFGEEGFQSLRVDLAPSDWHFILTLADWEVYRSFRLNALQNFHLFPLEIFVVKLMDFYISQDVDLLLEDYRLERCTREPYKVPFIF